VRPWARRPQLKRDPLGRSPKMSMTRKQALTPSVRWVDRLQLWMSYHTRYDGLTLSVLDLHNDVNAQLTRVKEALGLLERHDPRRYERLKRDCNRIWITLLTAAVGRYNHGLKAILLDQRYVSSSATSSSDIAATLVHELTHARLAACGIGYAEADRGRVERACYLQELAFARLLPNSESLVTQLESYQPSPDSHWNDETLHSATVEATPRALQYLGTPTWLIRLTVWLGSAIHRLRRRRAA
jgi:hypothetical protein